MALAKYKLLTVLMLTNIHPELQPKWVGYDKTVTVFTRIAYSHAIEYITTISQSDKIECVWAQLKKQQDIIFCLHIFRELESRS